MTKVSTKEIGDKIFLNQIALIIYTKISIVVFIEIFVEND
jgi:hypothetical protein